MSVNRRDIVRHLERNGFCFCREGGNHIGRRYKTMAYETKVILIALADKALQTDAREVYELISKMANADGIEMEPFDKAKAKIKE